MSSHSRSHSARRKSGENEQEHDHSRDPNSQDHSMQQRLQLQQQLHLQLQKELQSQRELEQEPKQSHQEREYPLNNPRFIHGKDTEVLYSSSSNSNSTTNLDKHMKQDANEYPEAERTYHHMQSSIEISHSSPVERIVAPTVSNSITNSDGNFNVGIENFNINIAAQDLKSSFHKGNQVFEYVIKLRSFVTNEGSDFGNSLPILSENGTENGDRLPQDIENLYQSQNNTTFNFQASDPLPNKNNDKFAQAGDTVVEIFPVTHFVSTIANSSKEMINANFQRLKSSAEFLKNKLFSVFSDDEECLLSEFYFRTIFKHLEDEVGKDNVRYHLYGKYNEDFAFIEVTASLTHLEKLATSEHMMMKGKHGGYLPFNCATKYFGHRYAHPNNSACPNRVQDRERRRKRWRERKKRTFTRLCTRAAERGEENEFLAHINQPLINIIEGRQEGEMKYENDSSDSSAAESEEKTEVDPKSPFKLSHPNFQQHGPSKSVEIQSTLESPTPTQSRENSFGVHPEPPPDSQVFSHFSNSSPEFRAAMKSKVTPCECDIFTPVQRQQLVLICIQHALSKALAEIDDEARKTEAEVQETEDLGFARRLLGRFSRKKKDTNKTESGTKSGTAISKSVKNVVRDAIRREIVFDVFPLHADPNPKFYPSIDEMYNQHASLRHFVHSFLTTLHFLPHSAIFMNYMRDYFGEKIALYFNFVHHVQTSMVYLAILGFIPAIYQFVDSIDSPVLLFYCFASMIWSAFFIKCWHRRTSKFMYEFNMQNYEKDEGEMEYYIQSIVNSANANALSKGNMDPSRGYPGENNTSILVNESGPNSAAVSRQPSPKSNRIGQRRLATRNKTLFYNKPKSIFGFYEPYGEWVDLQAYAYKLYRETKDMNVFKFIPKSYRDTTGKLSPVLLQPCTTQETLSMQLRFYELNSRIYRSMKACVGNSFILLLCALVMNFMLWMLIVGIYFDNLLSDYGSLITGILNGVVIFVLDWLYRIFAIKLTIWENHRTQTQFEDKLATKTFLFQFINGYFTLFYLAFAKPYIHFELGNITITSCREYSYNDMDSTSSYVEDNEDCVTALRNSLVTLIFTKMAISYVKQRWLPNFQTRASIMENLFENKHTKQKVSNVDDNEENASTPALKSKSWFGKIRAGFKKANEGRNKLSAKAAEIFRTIDRRCIDYQSAQPKFVLHESLSLIGTFDDYNDVAINYGYVVMFAPIFPLAPFLLLVRNYAEHCTDTRKLLYIHQRIPYTAAADIGRFYHIFVFLTLLSILTNSAIMVFTSTQTRQLLQNPPESWIVWSAILLEHLLAFIVFIIMSSIPDMEGSLRIALARQSTTQDIESKYEEWKQTSETLQNMLQRAGHNHHHHHKHKHHENAELNSSTKSLKLSIR